MTARARLITACSPRSWLSTSASRQLTILGLESSADDTCAAIVRSDRTILANVVLKQAAVHETFGGIHPMYAMEAHQRAMPRAIQEALNVSGLSLGDLDGIAVTRGPGM
jgi:N6-L-threonylcarbamoyladenine synthase